MVRLLTDNDFNGRMLRGLKRRRPLIDVVRVQDIGLAGMPDPEVLAWAAANDRIVVTHDRNTMIAFAEARKAASEFMPGLFVADATEIGRVIDTLELIDEQSDHGDWVNRIEFLPW
jgi:hypothetical protein